MGFGIGLLVGALLFGGCACSKKDDEKPERYESKIRYGLEPK